MPAVVPATIFGGRMDKAIDALIYIGYSEAEAERILAKKRNDEILKKYHHHAIWQTEDGIWRTKVPQDDPDRPTKKMQSLDRNKLEEAVVRYYEERMPKTTCEKLSLRSLYPEWIENKSRKRKPGTIKKDRTTWNRFFKDESIVDMNLENLMNEDLDAWVHEMINSHKMTKSSYSDFRGVLKQLLDYAKSKQYIRYNPYADVSVKPSEDLYLTEAKSAKEQIFFADEMDRFIEYSWEQYFKRRHRTQMFAPLAMIFMLYTGLRLSEVSALRFSDVENDILHIQRMTSYDSKIVEPRVKKGENRDIPLIPEALDIIAEVKQSRIERGYSSDGFIFCPDDYTPSTYKAIQNYVGIYCDELELFKHSAHDTRRTFISQLLDTGVLGVRSIMEISGHRDEQTFWKSYVYDTTSHEQKKEAMQKAFIRK